MNDHDLIQLATKYGSWFGNTLELRKEGLLALAKELYQRGGVEYSEPIKCEKDCPMCKPSEEKFACTHEVSYRYACEECDAAPPQPVSAEARMLRELLARIHRDGGHYVVQHGLDKAVEDADRIVSDLLVSQPVSAEPWEDGNGVIRTGVLPEPVSTEAGKGVDMREVFTVWARDQGYQSDELARCKIGIVSPEFYNLNTENAYRAFVAGRAPSEAVSGDDWREPHPPSRACMCPSCIPSFDDRFVAVSGEVSDEREEDAYVIQRISTLLAQIAVIVRGQEPPRRRWGYSDLPERVLEMLNDRDALMVALRNLVTSIKERHNLDEAVIWAEEAISKSAARAVLALAKTK